MGGDVCTRDQPPAGAIAISSDLWRELKELKELKQLIINQNASPTDHFLLETSFGNLIWSIVLCILWAAIRNCRKIYRFMKALCQMRRFRYIQNEYNLQTSSTKAGGSASAATDLHVGADPSDVNEGAMAVAAGITNTSENSNRSYNEEKEREMSFRKILWQLISAACKEVKKRIKGENDNLLPTHCTNSTNIAAANCPHPSPITDVSAQSSLDPLPVPLGMHLQSTLSEGQNQELSRQAERILEGSDTQNLSVETGSTFLSATVRIKQLLPSMMDLLDRATDLVKMGFRFDPTCTVQLGAAALLYTTSGKIVKTLLLKEGVYDVPIITSVQGFYRKTIMIKGFYLKDTEIKGSIASKKSVSLNVIFYQELNEGLEVLFAQLPQDELLDEKTLIYANKSIRIEGHVNPLVLRSISKKIDIHKHTSTILGTLCKRQIWINLLLICVYQVIISQSWHMPRIEWVFLIIFTSIFSTLLLEYIIDPWTLFFITRFLQYMMRSTNLDNILVLKEISMRNTQAFESSHTLSERNMVTTTNTREFESKSKGEDDDTGEDDDSDSIETRVGKGTLTNDLNWEWPCYERFLRRRRWVKELIHAKASKNESFDSSTGMPPFEVVTTLNQVDGSVEKLELIVHSTLLIQVLKECEPKTDAQFKQGFGTDPKEIFYRREALTAYVDRHSNRTGDNVQLSTSVWHVTHVLRFMKRHFAEALEQYERMQAEGCVSFRMLWTFFMPGDGVCRRCLLTNQECFATVRRPASYGLDRARDREFIYITLNIMDFNVRSYSKYTKPYKLDSFEGEVPFTSLQVCPLRFFPNRKDMETHFIVMGNIFYQVAMQQPFCFRQFKGSLNFYQLEGGCLRLHKLNADGRVMIDLLSFARMNPDYPSLESAQPPCEVMVGTWTPESGQTRKPSDEELKMAPAFAYGFSFRLKKWGCFELCGLREINFKEEAFGVLKMKNQNQKAILWSVVQQYTADESGNDNQSLDPIANKGTGCIVLCHGPPGTGKTLTAEALAETLRRPLWSISAFELGDEAREVEETLGQILEIAHLWRAILLLDEADAYLERRGEGVDVKRNLLTGVFLRVLEYYRGIMFLTTNRVTAFDDAILSRTTLAISYPPLDDKQRRAIWETLLQKHMTTSTIADGTFQALLQQHHLMNGREIRNIVHLALILARASGRPLQIDDVFTALDASTKDLPHSL